MEINHSPVPTGFCFKPTDQELIGGFLRYFLVDTPRLLPPPPHNTLMYKCNLFGNHSEPSEIWEAFEGVGALQLAAADQPALYFFSEITKKNPKGSKMVRKMGRSGGKWDGKAVPAWVEGTNGTSTCIGLKRTFCYKNVRSEDHGAWLLDEYSLFAAPRKRNSHTSYDFDYVLCRLRKNGVNKRKCPTSSSSEDDQVTTSKKRKKKKRANEEIEKDDGQEAESKQNMNAINVVEEEGRQDNSCLTSNLVVSDHEMNEFTVGDDVDYGYDDNDPRLTITVAELEEILASVEEEVLFPIASSTVVVADGAVEDQALNPNMLEELIPETQDLPLPAASGIAADGAVEENAWDPSLLEKYWLAETHEEEPLNPSFYKDFMTGIVADGGGVEEAYHPSAYENVHDQSFYSSSYLNNSFMEDQFMPPINIV